MPIFCVLIKSAEVEESQQLENSAGSEATDPFADQEQQLTRSSSTSDIADQFPSDLFQGTVDKTQRCRTSEKREWRLVQPPKCYFTCFGFQLGSKVAFTVFS